MRKLAMAVALVGIASASAHAQVKQAAPAATTQKSNFDTKKAIAPKKAVAAKAVATKKAVAPKKAVTTANAKTDQKK
ncbi:MAG: hypothetical protein WCG87_08520 [Bacteroidota bacterium]